MVDRIFVMLYVLDIGSKKCGYFSLMRDYKGRTINSGARVWLNIFQILSGHHVWHDDSNGSRQRIGSVYKCLVFSVSVLPL
jgi:hypothetical protein